MSVKYHDKLYEFKTLFCHNRQHEVKMMKLADKMGAANKSDVCRQLIDEAYKNKCL